VAYPQAADRYGVDRLKKMCEHKMLASISVDNAASIFHAADVYNAVRMRMRMMFMGGYFFRGADRLSESNGSWGHVALPQQTREPVGQPQRP
jgi:hypothetical protein